DGRAAMVTPEMAVFKTSRREKLDMCLVSLARVRTKDGLQSFARIGPGRTPPIRDPMLAHPVWGTTSRGPAKPGQGWYWLGRGRPVPLPIKNHTRPLDCHACQALVAEASQRLTGSLKEATHRAARRPVKTSMV